jgi:hypothetical protein
MDGSRTLIREQRACPSAAAIAHSVLHAPMYQQRLMGEV